MPVTEIIKPLYKGKTEPIALALLAARKEIIKFLKAQARRNGANKYFVPGELGAVNVNPLTLDADDEVVGFTEYGLLVDSFELGRLCQDAYENCSTDGLYAVYERVLAGEKMTHKYEN